MNIEEKIAELEKKIEITTNTKEKSDILLELSELTAQNSNYKESREYAIQSLDLLQEMDNKDDEVKALQLITDSFENADDVKGALDYYVRLLEIAKAKGDKALTIKSLNKIGDAYRRFHNTEKSLEHYTKALEINKELKDKKGIAETFNNIGLLYWTMSNYEKSLEYHLSSLKLREEIGDKLGIARSLNNIGLVYWNLNDFNKALNYHFKSLKIKEEIGAVESTASSLNNIGSVYYNLENYDKSLEYHLKALKMLEGSEKKISIAQAYNNIGSDYMNLKDFNKALEYFMKALRIKEEAGDKMGMANTSKNIGKIYFGLKNYDHAFKYLEYSLVSAQAIDAKLIIKDCYNSLHRIHSSKGDYKKALEYFKLYFEVNDSIFNEETRMKISEMEAKYLTEQKEKEAEIYRLKTVELENLNAKIQKQKKELEVSQERLQEELKERKKALEVLVKRDKLLKGINKANRALLTIPDYDEAVNESLKVLGEASDVNRVYVFENSKDSETGEHFMNQRFRWSNEGTLYKVRADLMNLSYKKIFPKWYETLSSSKIIKGLVKDFPENERMYIDAVSIIIVPIILEHEFWGFIGLEDVDEERQWLDVETAMLKTLARSIASTIISNRTKKALSDSEEKYRSMMETMTDGVYITSDDYRVLYMNPAMVKQVGYDATGKLCHKAIFNSDKKCSRCVTDEIKKGSEMFVVNNPMDGRTYQVSYTPLNKEANSVSKMFIYRDITEVKKAEEKLKEAKEKAEESDRLKSAFLSNMSHEIRTPMNAIIGFSDILSNQDITSDERKVYHDYIHNSCNSLSNLIDDIIDISKIEAGQIKIENTDFHINDLIEELNTYFEEMRVRKGKSKIELRVMKPSDMDDLIIRGDPVRLRQILVNLIGNAIKFTEEGFIEFGYTLMNKKTLQFYVKDTGIGIIEEEHNLIFKRFRQVDYSSARNYGGTGLGLAISKSLVELMDGRMWVSSNYGKGSTFYFTIPFKQRNEPERKISDGKETFANYSWKGKTILIVEDEFINYKLFEIAFKKADVDFIWAKSGEKAIEMCKSNDNIDLILMDIKLPNMNGYEVTKKIKEFRNEIPIIAQTAYAMQDEREKCLKAGCDDYISKPIDLDKLFSMINKFIGN